MRVLHVSEFAKSRTEQMSNDGTHHADGDCNADEYRRANQLLRCEVVRLCEDQKGERPDQSPEQTRLE